MWHWHGEGDWGAGDWVSMALMMLFIWLPILLVGFFLVRALAGPRGQSDERQEPAEEEARRAYARGEIDRERFLEIMRDLQDHPPKPR